MESGIESWRFCTRSFCDLVPPTPVLILVERDRKQKEHLNCLLFHHRGKDYIIQLNLSDALPAK